MKQILFALLLLPFASFAQYNGPYNGGMELWKEDECYKHVVKLITNNAGKLADTCEPVFTGESKDIYIISRDYLSKMHDTVNGYKLHFVNAEGDLTAIRKEVKNNNSPVLFFAKWSNYLETYYYVVFPVEIKKKELRYSNKSYRFHYFFHHENGHFEYQKYECLTPKE